KSKNDFKKDFPDVNVLQPPTLDTWQEENYGLAGLYYKTLIIDNEPRECEIKELKVDLPKVHVSFVYENLLVTVVGELKLLEKALLDLSFRPVSLTNYTYPESEKQMGTEAQTTWYDGYNPENEVFTTTAPY
ncbi:MAG: hypothetical protein FWF08_08005, partial [Oscillospiraceae bacterium]|nr:hypothetical protein [Oscillospiraceae bacterium]